MGLFDWLDEERKKRLPQISNYVDSAKKAVDWASNTYNPLDKDYWRQPKQTQQINIFNQVRDRANKFYDQDIKPQISGLAPDRGFDMPSPTEPNFVANIPGNVLNMSPTSRDWRRGVGTFVQRDLPQSMAGLYKSRVEQEQTDIPLLGPLSIGTGFGRVENPLISNEQRARNLESKQGAVGSISQLQANIENKYQQSDLPNQELSTDMAKQLGSGFASIGAATATTAIAGPGATFGLFGAMQKGQTYDELRNKGYSPKDADKISSVMGAVEGGIEALGSTVFLKKFGTSSGISNYALNTLVKTGTEGLQEGSQQLGENFVAGLTYDQQRKLTEGLFDSFFVGTMFGLLGGGKSGDIKTALYQKGREAGLDSKKAGVWADTMAPIIEKKSKQSGLVVNDTVEAVQSNEKVDRPEEEPTTQPVTPVTPVTPTVSTPPPVVDNTKITLPTTPVDTINLTKKKKFEEPVLAPDEFNLI